MKDYVEERERGFAAGMMTAMADGGVSVPYIFLKHYRKLNITDAEAVLIMHLIAFREKEEKAFPTIEELQCRMASDADAVIRMLQRLMKAKLIDIEESFDAANGMQVERYTLNPLYMKLAAVVSREEEQTTSDNSEPHSGAPRSLPSNTAKPGSEDNLFYIFEQEFGRPLSPMEIDTINGWLDQDQYPEPLILAALKEAVFAGKLVFRYVDRILLDWNRNNIHTVEQAREYAQQFRGMR